MPLSRHHAALQEGMCMPGRKIAFNWFTISFVATLAAVTMLFISRANNADAPNGNAVAHERVSETLNESRAPSNALADARTRYESAARTVATAGLIDTQPAAAASVREGVAKAALFIARLGLSSHEPESSAKPSLYETLIAADALVRAGKLEAPNPVQQAMIAADMLYQAGKLKEVTGGPTLAESLIAGDLINQSKRNAQISAAWENADELWVQGLLDPPVRSPLSDVLAAVQQIDALVQYDAGVRAAREASAAAAAAADTRARQAAQAPAAVPQVAPPSAPQPQPRVQAPAPTSTPVPPPPPPPAPPPAPAPAQAASDGPSDTGGWWDSGFGAEVFAIVNQTRAQHGLGSLSVEPRLARAASDYAKVLADNEWFSHTGPDGSTLVSRVEAAGFPFTVQVGEVLAWGQNNWQPAEIVAAWMDSPSHREQLLGPYTRAGVGCYFTAEDNTSVRCVMDFGG
jgi:uncharacterized protein YkwD